MSFNFPFLVWVFQKIITKMELIKVCLFLSAFWNNFLCARGDLFNFWLHILEKLSELIVWETWLIIHTQYLKYHHYRSTFFLARLGDRSFYWVHRQLKSASTPTRSIKLFLSVSVVTFFLPFIFIIFCFPTVFDIELLPFSQNFSFHRFNKTTLQ